MAAVPARVETARGACIHSVRRREVVSKSRRGIPLLLVGLFLGWTLPAVAEEAIVRTAQSRLWAAPRTDAPVLASIPEGQRVTILERVNPAWLKVRYTLPTGAAVVGFIPTAVVQIVDALQTPSPPGGTPSVDVGYVDWRQRLESARSTRRTLEAVSIAAGAASLLFTVLAFTDKSEECGIFFCESKVKTGYLVGSIVSAGVGLIAGAAWYSADRRVKALELEGLRKGYPQAAIGRTRDGWRLALRWTF